MPPRAVSIKTTHHAHCYICIGKLVLTSHVVSCVFIFSSFFCLPAQLGWYSDHEEDLTGFSLPGNDCTQMIEQQIDLVGLAEYDLASNDQKVIIKIPEPSKQRSFYVMYNRAIGINSGTDEAVDLVAVTRQVDQAVQDHYSFRLAELGQGESFTEKSFSGTGADL